MMEILDCVNLNCPMPIVKINKALRNKITGDFITVKANDPAFKIDLEAWIRKTKNSLISFEVSEEIFTAIIEKRT
jgi:tRNA 2-thiouridine synthesizing protein A